MARGSRRKPSTPESLARRNAEFGAETQHTVAAPLQQLSEAERGRMELQRVMARHRPGAPATLPTLPGVQSLSLATRYLDGGRDQFIEFVQMAMLNGDPAAIKWWTVYADLSPYPRSIVSFDDVCAAAGVEPAALCAILVSTAMRFGRDVANMIAAVTHPKVVDAQVRSAQRIDGEFAEVALRDRTAFLQGMGFLPVPKNTVANIHVSANAAAAAAAQAEPTVPKFADDIAMAAGTAPRRVGGGATPAALPSADEADPFLTVIRTTPTPVTGND